MTKNTDNAAVTKRRQYEEYSEIITELKKIIYKHYITISETDLKIS